MATELSDPHFCPPRQVRQGQGRGSVYEILSTKTALRFKPARSSGQIQEKINSSRFQDGQEDSKQKNGAITDKPAPHAADFNEGNQQQGVKRTPSFPVYSSARLSTSEITMRREKSFRNDDLSSCDRGARSSEAVVTVKGRKSDCKWQPPSKIFHEKFPSCPESSGREKDQKCKKEKGKSKGQSVADNSNWSGEVVERSQSWVWSQEELVDSENSYGFSQKISEKKPSQDSGILISSPSEKEISASENNLSQSSLEIAACRVFHARVLSTDNKEDSGGFAQKTGDKSSGLVSGQDDSAWFGSGVHAGNMIIPEDRGGLDSSVDEEPLTACSPGDENKDGHINSTGSIASSGDRNSEAVEDCPSPSASNLVATQTGTELLSASSTDSMKVVASSTPKVEDPVVSSAYVDYDSETLRRAAAKNREVSKKLFSKLRERQNERRSIASPRHERQSSGLSVTESLESGDGCFLAKRTLTKSPSQVSSSGTNSIYAESSSGSSGIGTLTNSLTKEYACSSVILRSSSSDALNSRYSTGHAPNNTGCKSTGQDIWNTPQQRKNILSMVEQQEPDFLTVPSETQKAATVALSPQATEFVCNTHGQKTHSSVAANRGVSRKISSRKKAAKDDVEYMKSMPNLIRAQDDKFLHQELEESFGPRNIEELNRSEDYSGLNLGDVSSADLDCSSRVPRTEFLSGSVSPVYAVPNKEHQLGSNLNQRVSGSLANIDFLAMKSPPPLPRKPPPPLSDLIHGDCLPTIPSYDKYSSSPCLHYQASEMSESWNGSESSEYFSTVMWPKAAQSRIVAPAEPHSALPVTSVINTTLNRSSPNVALSSGGKPTVQVHPMCLNEDGTLLCVNVDGQTSPAKKAHIPPTTTPSPRPPVPKKPEFLLSPSDKQQTVPTAGNSLPGSTKNAGRGLTNQSELTFRQEQLNSVENRCSRLLEYVGENDRRLRDILNPNHTSSLDRLGESHTSGQTISVTATGVNTDNDIRYHQRLANNYEEAVYPYTGYDVTTTNKAKFLVGIYSSRTAPHVSHTTRDSVDSADSFELERKKLELIASLSRKLKILEEERKAIQEELCVNEKLGSTIQDWLHSSAASDYHCGKYRLHVDDTEKITCLLLRLSGQIGRVENAISKLPPNVSSSEKVCYELLRERRERLLQQQEDAKNLRVSLERRGEKVLGFLGELLTEEQVGDYHYFIQMKRKLLVDAREIEDKIKLGLEQKEALERTLHNGRQALDQYCSDMTRSASSLVG